MTEVSTEPLLSLWTTSASNISENGNASTKEPYVPPFNDIGTAIFATLIFIFLAAGLIGNILTLLVIGSSSKLQNVFMCFISSLCVSDLMSACISWLCLYRRTWGFDDWEPVPNFFCKLYWGGDLMTSYVTAFHIFSFACLRYASIQFSTTFSKITIYHARIWISAIWILCFLLGFIPFFIFFGAKFRDRYSDSPDARWPSCTIDMDWYDIYLTYQKIGYPTFFYAPSAGIVVVSLLIAITVRTRSFKMKSSEEDEKRKKKENQAVLQLVLIVFSFLIGYIPFTAYEFWSVQPRENSRYFKLFDYYFGVVQYLFLRLSECMNPVFYNLGSTKMRKCTARYVRQKLASCFGSNDSNVIVSFSKTRVTEISSH